MVAVFTLLSVVAISIVIVRVATKALQLTGLSAEAARFQAYSAFSGTGFTTEEAEDVVRQPVRRRIVMIMMLLRNAGLVTAVSTLVLSFVGTETGTETLRRGVMLIAGLGVLVLLARSSWTDRQLSRVIDWALKRYTNLNVRDYYTLLNLKENYNVSRFEVHEGAWLADKTIQEVDLVQEGVLVLGILRADGSYLGTPRGRYRMHAGDTLVLYGKRPCLDELESRLQGSSGDAAHEKAKHAHERELHEQDIEDARQESLRSDYRESESRDVELSEPAKSGRGS
jgi:hypothetical protein